MNKVLEATDDKYKIRQDVVTLAECREQIKLHANNIASDITNTFVNKNRILSLRTLLDTFEIFNAHMNAEKTGYHNEFLGYNNVSQHIKNNPGENEYSCEFCGFYTASKPACNKCKL